VVGATVHDAPPRTDKRPLIVHIVSLMPSGLLGRALAGGRAAVSAYLSVAG